jgi:phage shock protein PspC (stress-responsive transcriptional regulator)
MNKRLVRPRKGRIIGGVAKGLADYFGVNVLFVRFIWFVLLMPGGLPGIIPYIILWLIIPAADTSTETTKNESSKTPIV